MRYRLRVSYRSDGRTYAPGDILPEGIPIGDLAYLKDKRFVESVDVVFPGTDAPGQGDDDAPDAGPEDEGLGISFPKVDAGEGMKTPGEIQKMRTKDEVYAYAQSIGLDLGDGYREESLKGLQEQVISFQGGVG